MRFLVLLLLSEATASAKNDHKRPYDEMQKRHDEATASGKDDQKRQYYDAEAT